VHSADQSKEKKKFGWALVAPSRFALQVLDGVFGYSYLVHDNVLNFDEDGT